MTKFSFFNMFSNSSSIMNMILEQFNDFTNMILLMIISFILMFILKSMNSKITNYKFSEDSKLEVIWTIFPMFILITIAFPSIFYLYLFDLSMNPSVTTKVFGAQWYWIYEKFDNTSDQTYSSYMLNDLDMISNDNYNLGWRLIQTDTRMIVPYGTEIQCLLTSMDVIHSFSIPELGIKTDAVPGRLNSMNFQIMKPGVYYGQCAEICGTGHAFMPICMEVV